MAKEAEVNYDEENDILFVSSDKLVNDSVDFDNFVIDFDKNGIIVGVEIMGAFDFVKKSGMSKKMISSIEKASLSVIQQGREYALIKIVFVLEGENKKELIIPSPVPQTINCK